MIRSISLSLLVLPSIHYIPGKTTTSNHDISNQLLFKNSHIDLPYLVQFQPNYPDLISAPAPALLGNEEAALPTVENDVHFSSLPSFQLPYDETLVSYAFEAIKYDFMTLCNEGLGGTYLVKNGDGEMVAVFKPSDEEPGCIGNPKGNFNSPKKGVKIGDGYIREIAAFMLDHEHIAGVPFTQCFEIDGFDNYGDKKKIGSLQKYVPNIGSLTDLSPSLFSVEDVHRIAQLDIRLFNIDRNDENFLVTKENNVYHLIPIDHAYSLPNSLIDGPWFDWINWKQAKQPISETMLDYINRIDIEKDSEILRNLGIEEEAIRVMKMSTLVLKLGAKAGKNFHQIASFLCRPSLKSKSPLEILVNEVEERNDSKEFWDIFINILSERIARQK